MAEIYTDQGNIVFTLLLQLFNYIKYACQSYNASFMYINNDQQASSKVCHNEYFICTLQIPKPGLLIM